MHFWRLQWENHFPSSLGHFFPLSSTFSRAGNAVRCSERWRGWPEASGCKSSSLYLPAFLRRPWDRGDYRWTIDSGLVRLGDGWMDGWISSVIECMYASRDCCFWVFGKQLTLMNSWRNQLSFQQTSSQQKQQPRRRRSSKSSNSAKHNSSVEAAGRSSSDGSSPGSADAPATSGGGVGGEKSMRGNRRRQFNRKQRKSEVDVVENDMTAPCWHRLHRALTRHASVVSSVIRSSCYLDFHFFLYGLVNCLSGIMSGNS